MMKVKARYNNFCLSNSIYQVMLFIVIVFCTSCEDWLHEEEISIGKITNYNQLKSATDGVYGALAENFYFIGSFQYANVKGD